MDEADPSAASRTGETSELRDAGMIHGSRAQAVRRGMWHGAKVGFVAFCVVLPGMWFGILLFCLAFVPNTNQAVFVEVERALQEAKQANLLSAIGWTLVFFGGFGTLYGAIPGALIGGLVEAIRWRPSKPTQISDR